MAEEKSGCRPALVGADDGAAVGLVAVGELLLMSWPKA
jgi:hypothetical protein